LVMYTESEKAYHQMLGMLSMDLCDTLNC